MSTNMEDLDTKQDPLSDEQTEGEASLEDSGPINCPECAQPYGGPPSLKRHLWRIHRLSGDDAQALVEKAVAAHEERKEEELLKEEQVEETKGANTNRQPQVKPLLDMTVTPKVRPLLSLPAEPPGYQANNFGGISPAPTWGTPQQAGLLPTPGCEEVPQLDQDYISEPDLDPPSILDLQSESGNGSKIKPLMEINIGGGGGGNKSGGGGGGGGGGPVGGASVGSSGGGGGGGGGIPSLMSLPLLGGGGGAPYMQSGGMGIFYQRNTNRRRGGGGGERRHKPYNNRDRHSHGNSGNNQNGGHNTNKDDQGGPEACGECGAVFQDSADLADHEINSHNVSIDLNCDVELTA